MNNTNRTIFSFQGEVREQFLCEIVDGVTLGTGFSCFWGISVVNESKHNMKLGRVAAAQSFSNHYSRIMLDLNILRLQNKQKGLKIAFRLHVVFGSGEGSKREKCGVQGSCYGILGLLFSPKLTPDPERKGEGRMCWGVEVATLDFTLQEFCVFSVL